MSDSSDEEHKGPVGNLKELLNKTTFVMGGQDREWTRRYKWVKVCHRVLVQQDHILCVDQMQRVEPMRKEDKSRSNMKSPKELAKVAVLKLKLIHI